jgi:hypothetical protein
MITSTPKPDIRCHECGCTDYVTVISGDDRCQCAHVQIEHRTVMYVKYAEVGR